MVDIEFYRDLCRPLGGVTSKRMFGGLCLWHEGLAFALVIDGVLYFKVDEVNRPAFAARDLPHFAYTTKTGRTTVMSYARAPEEVFDDPDAFADWARRAIGAARRAAAEKAAKPARRPAKRRAAGTAPD
jgi:DNA transformation protein